MAYDPYVNPATRPQDLQPNAFGGTGGSILSNAVISAYDIYNPAEWPVVFSRHGDVPGFGSIIRAAGFTKGCSNPTTGHYEYPWRDNLVRINTIQTPAGGAGQPIVVNLTADSMYNSGVTVGGSPQQASYPRVGQIIKTPTGAKAMITVKTTTVTPHRLTLVPVDSTVDLDDHVIEGGQYFISDNAWGEGTGLPEGVTPRVMKYTNGFQIVKEATGATGTELTNHTWFDPIPGRPGSFFLKAKDDTYKRFEDQKDGALLWGSAIDNVTVASNAGHDVAVSGTEGLITFAETNSLTHGYTVGGFAMNDFDTIGDAFEDERIKQREIMSLEGKAFYNEKENLLLPMLNGDLSALFAKNWMGYDTIGPDWQPATASDHAALFGFTAVKKGGYTFVWKVLHEFNYVHGAGAPGYDWRNSAILMPVGWANDRMTGEKRGLFGYEYKQSGSYSRENVVDEIAGIGVGGTGTGRRAVNGNDILQVGFVSEIAGHYACANSIVLVRPN